MILPQNDNVGEEKDIEVTENPEKKKLSKTKKIILIVVCSILSLLVVLTSIYFILYKLGKDKLLDNDGISSEDTQGVAIDEDIVDYKGEKYRLNKNVTSLLFLGIDKDSINDNNDIGENGQADVLFLTCIDTKTKAVKIIPISREAMVGVDLYSEDGSFGGMENRPICLAYAYGKDAKAGCDNVKNSVSRLLCGIDINSCVAIDLNAIKVLTDKIGGISLNSLETVAEFKEGEELLLKGSSALRYVQVRGDDVEASNRRAARQKQFLGRFASAAGNKVLSDFTIIPEYYSAAKPYVYSDLDLSEITFLARNCLTKDMGKQIEYLSISGETKMGEEYVEFYADTDSVYEAVLSAFYKKIS